MTKQIAVFAALVAAAGGAVGWSAWAAHHPLAAGRST